MFAGFSAVWTSVALLLTGPAYGMSARAVGLLALVNATTMLCTPFAGRQVDRRGPDPVNLVCFLVVAVSAAVLVFGGLGGVPGLTALVVGTLLLDVGMQSGMVANQVRIYALGSEVRSRLNTAYMTCAYLGGSVGSWLGARCYDGFGWPGVCALVALLTSPAVARHLVHLRRSSARCAVRAGSASRFLVARRLENVAARTSTMKPSEKGMEISGTWTPDSCRACSTSLPPMKPRMIDRP